MITFLIIYFIGIIVSWFLFKLVRYIDPDLKDDIPAQWEAIKISFIISLFSWFGVVIGIVASVKVFYGEVKEKDPPKWL